ncbi:MAG: TetR/AcrR family transcriptional regulator [Pseudomonadota bacterium]|nr:TetR/AcrR family transcriptional regulator [Pseudomonadota bacterium]
MSDRPKLTIAQPDPPDADGRRARSERSRVQIVDAMFRLIGDGDYVPSAASVAEEAGVGLRTVFRHFEDVDALYRELIARLETEILPQVMQPWTSTDWRARLSELISRRARIYERIMPYKVAANLRRFQSEWLMHDYQRFLRMERSGLFGALPDEISADKELTSALEMLTGFQTWRRMRQDQLLTIEEAESVLQRTAKALTAHLA